MTQEWLIRQIEQSRKPRKRPTQYGTCYKTAVFYKVGKYVPVEDWS